MINVVFFFFFLDCACLDLFELVMVTYERMGKETLKVGVGKT